jgi:hypothetical protein
MYTPTLHLGFLTFWHRYIRHAFIKFESESLLDADPGSRLRTLSNRGWLPFTGNEAR